MSNISYFAIKTIIFHKVKIYFKEFQFNIIAPLINTLLFVFILSIIISYHDYNLSKDSSYINFLVPGILITVVIQASFSHLSEVIISMKQIGSFNDYLVSPISRSEIFLSLVISSLIVCTFIAIVNFLFLSFFINIEKINILISLYYIMLTILTFSSIGALIGFISFSWDIQSATTNFFIVPISLCSGSFFSIDSLDKQFQFILVYNPFYYLINGFRSAFYDNYELKIFSELFILIVVLSIFLISLYIFKKGYKVIS